MCLPFHSCHPRHCVRSIPYSLALRLRRICSADYIFDKRASELQDRLEKRGYPSQLVEASIKKVRLLQRTDVLNYIQPKKTHDRVPFIITHNPSHPPLDKWLRSHMTTLHRCRRMKKAVPLPPIVGKRNCANLRQLLMKSSLPSGSDKVKTQGKGCLQCMKVKCVVCKNHLQQTKTFRSVRTGQTFHIRDEATCSTRGLIYLVDCGKCGDVQYVGETERSLAERFYGHRYDIRHPSTRDTLVAKHFNSTGHRLSDLRCTVIEVMRTGDQLRRRERERFWRHKLKTNYPQGLNVWD